LIFGTGTSFISKVLGYPPLDLTLNVEGRILTALYQSAFIVALVMVARKIDNSGTEEMERRIFAGPTAFISFHFHVFALRIEISQKKKFTFLFRELS
jgi:hypothetical protein